MSVIALFAIHMTLAHYSFSFTPLGLSTYIGAFASYGALFAGTIATTGVYFGLLRADSAIQQNNDKLRQDRFSEWRVVLEIRASEIEKYDPFMKREFVRVRWQFFNELHSRNFTIADKATLSLIFNTVFKDLVSFFETQNNRHISMGGAYPNNTSSYSFDSFRFLFLGSIETLYTGIDKDLMELYIAALPKDRHIDVGLYEAALRNPHKM